MPRFRSPDFAARRFAEFCGAATDESPPVGYDRLSRVPEHEGGLGRGGARSVRTTSAPTTATTAATFDVAIVTGIYRISRALAKPDSGKSYTAGTTARSHTLRPVRWVGQSLSNRKFDVHERAAAEQDCAVFE